MADKTSFDFVQRLVPNWLKVVVLEFSRAIDRKDAFRVATGIYLK